MYLGTEREWQAISLVLKIGIAAIAVCVIALTALAVWVAFWAMSHVRFI